MMTLILHHIFYKKKLIASGLLILSYIIVLIAIAMTGDTALDRMLYPNETMTYFLNVSQQIITFISSALIATIIFDFEANYDLPLYAYFSRPKVIKVKIFTHLIIIVLLVIFIISIQILILISFYHLITYQLIMDNLWYLLDMLMLSLWMILLTPSKFKQSSFLVVALYILITIIQEDISSPMIFYLVPFHHMVYSNHVLSIYYVLIYSFILYILVYLKEINKTC